MWRMRRHERGERIGETGWYLCRGEGDDKRERYPNNMQLSNVQIIMRIINMFRCDSKSGDRTPPKESKVPGHRGTIVNTVVTPSFLRLKPII